MGNRVFGRIAIVVLLASVVGSWVLTLKVERDRKQLTEKYAAAQAALTEAELARKQLSDEVWVNKKLLAEQDEELTGLQAELSSLQTKLADAHQEINRLHTEQVALIDHHQGLTERLAVVTQENQRLEAKLSSIKELKSAIRVVRARLQDEQHQARLAMIQHQRTEDQKRLAQGNRGFVVRNGTSTIVAERKLGTKLQVRVLDPQTE